MLVVIAVDVPLLFGFSVARYAGAPRAPGARGALETRGAPGARDGTAGG
jgi:hypothetical protein